MTAAGAFLDAVFLLHSDAAKAADSKIPPGSGSHAFIEDGRYPNDIARGGKIVETTCCSNAIRFFGL